MAARRRLVTALALLLHCAAGCTRSGSIRFGEHLIIVAWNVEHGGSNPDTIAKQLSQRPSFPADIYCLSGVDPDFFERFREAAYRPAQDKAYASVEGSSGKRGGQQILYDAARFELLEFTELASEREPSTGDHAPCRPLAAHFSDKSNDDTFWVVAAHLADFDAAARQQHAIALREWVRETADSSAVFLLGDLRLEVNTDTRAGGEVFSELSRDDVLKWVQPNEMIDTHWLDANADGTDDEAGLLQDGIFVGGAAKDWLPTCRVITSPADFPDDAATSSHRPISLWLRMPVGGRN